MRGSGGQSVRFRTVSSQLQAASQNIVGASPKPRSNTSRSGRLRRRSARAAGLLVLCSTLDEPSRLLLTLENARPKTAILRHARVGCL
jgi:hypothetical protein